MAVIRVLVISNGVINLAVDGVKSVSLRADKA
jgi:hypothetical protein